MMSADQMWGGNPHRAHNLGKSPFDEANKVTHGDDISFEISFYVFEIYVTFS